MSFLDVIEKANPKAFEEALIQMPELVKLIDNTPIFQNIKQKIEAKGREEGREEGRRQTQTEFALKLLKRQNPPFSVDDIIDLTGLTKKAVLDLQSTLNSQHN